MKKLLLFGMTLFFLLACSKESFLSPASDFSSSIDKQMSRIDSISKMNARGVCIKSILTPRIIDSLKKMEVPNNGSFIGISPEIKSALAIGDEYTDRSGQIHLKIFSVVGSPTNHNTAICHPDDGWVLVGGGVLEQSGSGTHPDASFLITNRPNDDLTAWIGSSKDHYWVNSHGIVVYAIGMKLNGVDPAYLKSKIHLHTQQGALANHPYASASIPSNELLLGGGAYDDYTYYGNMLVTSYPSSPYAWYASGKDQHWADPGTITAYAIGIENIDFPNFGRLETTYFLHIGQYPLMSISTDVPGGWALTCSGGYIDYSHDGLGVLMKDCCPTSNYQTLCSAAQCYYTNVYGKITTYACAIRKVQ
jgi:hypothetical protein